MGFIYQEANAYGVEALVALERHYTPTEEKYCTAVTEAVRICDTYGIGVPQRNPEEISSVYGLTRERVRQIREKGIQKIRNSVYAKYLTKYLG